MEKDCSAALKRALSLSENPYKFLATYGIMTAQFIVNTGGLHCVLYFQYRENSDAKLMRSCAELFLQKQYGATDISYWRNPDRPNREFFARFIRSK